MSFHAVVGFLNTEDHFVPLHMTGSVADTLDEAHAYAQDLLEAMSVQVFEHENETMTLTSVGAFSFNIEKETADEVHSTEIDDATLHRVSDNDPDETDVHSASVL